MGIDVVISAIETHKCIDFTYDGISRRAEAHTVGVTTTGKTCMSVYQLDGGSVNGDGYGWKLMSVDKANYLALSSIDSEAPREGYKRGDRRFVRILAEV